MKCQQCDKQAVFHITELEAGAVRELHLCEDHARTYLNQSEGGGGGASDEEGKPKAGGLAGALDVGQTADELAILDQRACDHCGITFFEFRNQGRLGCPHDYVQFEKELEPLIANIHGMIEHTGRPAGGDRRTDRRHLPAPGDEGSDLPGRLRKGQRAQGFHQGDRGAVDSAPAQRGVTGNRFPLEAFMPAEPPVRNGLLKTG